MASKKPTSVIGVDLGRYSLKSVLLQRKGPNRTVLTHYGCHVPTEPAADSETLGKQLKALFKDMGGSAKSCTVSISSPDAIIRIIEQPTTPPEILREALRLNGLALLNQECKTFVIDCDRITSSSPAEPSGDKPTEKYLVGGIPRTEVSMIGSAVAGIVSSVESLQLAPISVFNAFEFAQPEVFQNEAFFLVDIGHSSSTMMMGAKGELILVRTIDFGGRALLEALTGLSGEGNDSVFAALDHEDEVMVEYTRVAMATLTREIGSSIGFFEHRREETITKIHVSGGPAKSSVFLKLMGEEVGMPCQPWSAAENCETQLSGDRQAHFDREQFDLTVAMGAAVEALKDN